MSGDDRQSGGWRARLRPVYRFAVAVPAVLRSLLGICLIGLGLLGFLPILGFWMVPLGILFVAADVPPWRRRAAEWLGFEEEIPR